MMLQIIGLWAVVALVVVWFIRDEQRRRDLRERVASMAHVAHRPRTQTQQSAPAMPSPMRQPVLSEEALELVSRLGKLHRES